MRALYAPAPAWLSRPWAGPGAHEASPAGSHTVALGWDAVSLGMVASLRRTAGRYRRQREAPLRQRFGDGAVRACCATWHRHRLTAAVMAQDALPSIVSTRHAFPQLAHHDAYFPSPCVSGLL